jgi:anti-sigma-K factor RskA
MTGHETWADSVGAYMLGALPDAEREGFEDHLATCAICREDVERLRLAAEALPASPPTVAPPPELRDRIMAVVRSEAELLQAAGGRADASEPPRRRIRLGRRLPSIRPAFALAAVAGALAVGVAGGLSLSGGDVGPGTRTLAAQTADRAVSARLVVRDGHGTLVAQRLPAPGEGRVYQVWLKRPGRAAPEPTNALFGVRRDGSASVDVPGSLAGVEAVMVTSEPDGGSESPTRRPLIVARLA